MRKIALVLVVVLGAGCYGGVHGGVRVRGNPFAVAATVLTVAAIAHAISTPPPPVVHVEYYAYGDNPGHVWVNGRYVYSGNQYAWQPGYWQAERPGQYWVQGSWTQQGNGYVWVDGYWAAPRAGYVYVDGYWDARPEGYAWVQGTWEVERPGYVYVGGSWSTYSGRRTWQRGGWQRDDGRAEWGRYRTRGRASGRVIVRDHR